MAQARFLVDSSVWIDYLRDGQTPEAKRFDHAMEQGHDLFTTGFIMTEVLQGIRSDRLFRSVHARMAAFPRVDPVVEDHVHAAELYRRACRRGVTIRSSIDCLIATLCLHHDLDLLRADRDFDHLTTVCPLRTAKPGGRT